MKLQALFVVIVFLTTPLIWRIPVILEGKLHGDNHFAGFVLCCTPVRFHYVIGGSLSMADLAI